jgi:hypothetical protein
MTEQREEVFIRKVSPDDVENEIKKILLDVDQGVYDDELKREGIDRNQKLNYADNIKIERPQGLTPGDWYIIYATFSPAIAYGAKTIWDKIVIRLLQRKFHLDRVARDHPKKSSKKAESNK